MAAHQHRTAKEEIVDTNLVANAESLRQIAERLTRVGLIVDRACLTPEQRRAAFALQCVEASTSAPASPTRPPIGFAYPNPR